MVCLRPSYENGDRYRFRRRGALPMRSSSLRRHALALTLLSGCGGASHTSHPASDVVHVVAGENFWGNIARQIGGDHVAVTSIISDPNADPHIYESDPKDAAAISARSGRRAQRRGYDDFASKLLAPASKSRTVLSVAKVVGITGSNPNPHLWYDPATSRRSRERDRAGASPGGSRGRAGTSRPTCRPSSAAYQPYAARSRRSRQRYAGARIAYTERVPGYLVAGRGPGARHTRRRSPRPSRTATTRARGHRGVGRRHAAPDR